jgi:carboxyl-terminal processing protease
MTEEKDLNKKSSFAFMIKFIASIVILLVTFELGVYFAGKKELMGDFAKVQAVYAGKLLGQYSEPQAGVLAQDIDFALFWEVWDYLHKNYVDQDKISDKSLFYGALKGMVAAVDDPYTIFMDPKISKEFNDDLSGTFEGIGAEIGIKDDILTVVAPLPDMPAEKAGLKAGDKILAIDKELTTGMSVDMAVSKIRGDKGTEVILTIGRIGQEGTKDYPIKRDKIVVKSVKTEMRKDGYYVVTISSFNNDTMDLFNQAITDILQKNPKGIILDLRNNPGGYLEMAIEMASKWIGEGVIVSEQFSESRKNDHLSRGRAVLKDYKTVVLVNEGSASASEIVAGALQDYGKAVILGAKTFGKGSVQSLNELKDGSSIKITVAKWLTPKGRSINELGIEPDRKVNLNLEDFNNDKDPQLDRALDILNGIEFKDDVVATSTPTQTTNKASSTKATTTKTEIKK